MTSTTEAIDLLFRPGSVAIVGASNSPVSSSGRLLARLAASRYAGSIRPINPRGGTIGGYRAYRNIGDLDEPIDVALIMRPSLEIAGALRECANAGVQVAVLYNAVIGDEELGRTFNTDIARVIDATGIRVLGPNSLGTYNLSGDVPLTYGFAMPSPVAEHGLGIAAIGHSGGVVQSIAAHAIAMGAAISHFASLGNEADLEADDFIEYFTTQPEVGVIAVYLEQIRRPQRLLEVITTARKSGKEIVLLRVGRSAVGRQIARSHTGAIVGSLEHERAFLDELGVHWAASIKQAAVMAVAVRARTKSIGAGIGVVTTSGGVSGLLADLAESKSIPLPELEPSALAELRPLLEPSGTVDPNLSNPIDLGALGVSDPALWLKALELVLSQKSVGAGIVLVSDNYFERAESVLELAKAIGKPVIFQLFKCDGDRYASIAMRGAPVFTADEDCLTAAAAILRTSRMPPEEARSRQAQARTDTPQPCGRSAIPDVTESHTKEWLASANIAVPRGSAVKSLDEACTLLDHLNTPVVLKVSDPRATHKSDVGGVTTDIVDEVQLVVEWNAMTKRLEESGLRQPTGFRLEEQLPRSGFEWLVGVHNDFGFGPAIAVGLGGVLAEAMNDHVIIPCPVTAERAMQMLGSLRAWDVLIRRRQVSNTQADAFASIISTVSILAYEARDWLAELDLNPVVLTHDTAVALDARAVPRDRSGSE